VGGTRQFGHFSECYQFPQTTVKNDVKTMTAAISSFFAEIKNMMAEAEQPPNE
jgi:hypothetical protein